MPTILAVDIGTTTCKALLTNETGAEMALTVHPYAAGTAPHQPEQWWESLVHVVRGVRGALPRPVPDIIGLCGRGGGLALLDRRHQPLPIPWDAVVHAAAGRTRPWSRRYNRLAAWARHLEAVGATAPELFEQIRHITGVKDYLNLRLTGEWATEPFSAGTRDWPKDLRRFGMPRSWLPPIHGPEQVLGTLRAAAATQLHLPPGIPVVTGGHDGVCANLGAGLTEPGEGCITLGTAGVVRINTDNPLFPTAASRTFSYPYIDELWTSGGDLPSGSRMIAWVSRLLGLMGPAGTSGQADLSRIQDQLNTLAETAPAGARGALFLPYIHGSDCPYFRPDATGLLAGLQPDHGPEHTARAVMEGVGFGLRAIREAVIQRGAHSTRLALTGGGARSPIWRAIVASILWRPLDWTDNETSALGAAMLAAVGSGTFTSVKTASQAMRGKGIQVDPVPAWLEVYEESYRRFSDLARQILR